MTDIRHLISPREDELHRDSFLHRNFALEAVRVTEAAAIAAYEWIGCGDEREADRAAVNAMRQALNILPIDGTVVIGEGERDKAPMLYIGEKVGTGYGPEVDIALDPLEGTTICAHAGANSMAVVAIAEKSGFLHAPDVYMEKIAVGKNLPADVVSLEETAERNLKNLAKARKCEVADLMVCVLQRKRHEELIAKIREAGARVKLITDGDVAGVIATTDPEKTDVHVYMGIGGAPEGVLAAAALRCVGGQMQGKLLFDSQSERERAKRMGIDDFSRIYSMEDMAKGNVMFSATGVTDGPMLGGIRREGEKLVTHSVIMRSLTGTVRSVKAEHLLKKKTG
jgi:fructose-1,6-bisphosphatase II / sedoheptulose-1,7-bisphosphatase